MNGTHVSDQGSAYDVDLVEEMRMRAWARRNYAPVQQRDENWHPIVLDEMTRKDRERTYPHTPK